MILRWKTLHASQTQTIHGTGKFAHIGVISGVLSVNVGTYSSPTDGLGIGAGRGDQRLR